MLLFVAFFKQVLFLLLLKLVYLGEEALLHGQGRKQVVEGAVLCLGFSMDLVLDVLQRGMIRPEHFETFEPLFDRLLVLFSSLAGTRER